MPTYSPELQSFLDSLEKEDHFNPSDEIDKTREIFKVSDAVVALLDQYRDYDHSMIYRKSQNDKETEVFLSSISMSFTFDGKELTQEEFMSYTTPPNQLWFLSNTDNQDEPIIFIVYNGETDTAKVLKVDK